ncbi:DUF1566 domain-containing protein [Ideonella sp. YS5]|uniref:Lcl C-terminal domain-containing protein n=1 Tax=Ideonella sp. YS5 TaxID=3453714 RepID=UPI003EEBC0CD
MKSFIDQPRHRTTPPAGTRGACVATARKANAGAVLAVVAAAMLSPAMAAPSGSTGTVDLRGVTQNWDKVLPAEPGAGCPNWSTRFTCVMNNAAVRDNETGLVWAQPLQYTYSWYMARETCLNLNLGNRKGWRLPSVTELATLIDMSNPSQLKIPANWPFIFQKTPGFYWTATPYTSAYANEGPTYFIIVFEGGGVGNHVPEVQLNAWCVRGGPPEGSPS